MLVGPVGGLALVLNRKFPGLVEVLFLFFGQSEVLVRPEVCQQLMKFVQPKYIYM